MITNYVVIQRYGDNWIGDVRFVTSYPEEWMAEEHAKRMREWLVKHGQDYESLKGLGTGTGTVEPTNFTKPDIKPPLDPEWVWDPFGSTYVVFPVTYYHHFDEFLESMGQ